MPKGGCY